MEEFRTRTADGMKRAYHYELNKPFRLFKWLNPKRPHMRMPVPDYRSLELLKRKGTKKVPTWLEQAKGKIVFKYIEETPLNKKILENATKEKNEKFGAEELPILVNSKLRDVRTRHRVFLMDPPPGFDPHCKDHWTQFFSAIIKTKSAEETSEVKESVSKSKVPMTETSKKIKSSIKSKWNIRKARREPIIVFPGVSVTEKLQPPTAPISPKLQSKETSGKGSSTTNKSNVTTTNTSSTSDSDVQLPLPAASDSLLFYKKKLVKESCDNTNSNSSAQTDQKSDDEE